MDTGILLESGTNELEILEFMVGNNRYGINVAKIREIYHCLDIKRLVFVVNLSKADRRQHDENKTPSQN